ncbi:MAG: hypothetical protein MAGBODY4_00533 [Candidatus Marinimicrobia bacterium]|nr:hypothetical protein [Candidatus Neomarinimicrobiota bacterium]
MRNRQLSTRQFTFSVILAGLLFFLPLQIFSQVRVNTSIDTTQGYIGDVFHLSINAEHPKGYTLNAPTDVQNLEDFSVRDVKRKSGRTQSSVTYSLAVYDTGRYTIPSVNVQVVPPDTAEKPLKFSSEPISITILSMVPPDAQGLKDIKPLMDLPAEIPWLWISIGAILLIFVLLAVWWWLHRRGAEPEPEMTPAERRQSAHERAYKRLRKIEKAEYPEKGAMKQHFSEISETIRAYFEDRFFIPALEMTSTEVIRAFPEHRIEPDISEEMTDLLTTSDLVKFAKYKPSLEEADRVLSEAYHIVDTTKIEITTSEDEDEASDTDESEIEPEHAFTENKGESP